MFKFTENDIKKYEEVIPPWGPVGQVVHSRTYSRPLWENGKIVDRETWLQTCVRVIEGNMNLIPDDPTATREWALEALDSMFNMAWIPPGRGLWQLGTEYAKKRGGDALNNCWMIRTAPGSYEDFDMLKDTYVYSDPHEPMASFPFVFMFDRAMLGGGVGFGVPKEDMESFPKITTKIDLQIVMRESHPDWARARNHSHLMIDKDNNKYTTIKIEDSREGWAVAVRELIDIHYHQEESEKGLTIDISDIREYGQPLKGFGGTASGPLPLVEALHNINRVLNIRVGDKMTSTDAVDIMNLLGRCVVSGNIRRCLPEDTLVHTSEGLIPIQDINVGDKVQTVSGMQKVTDWVKQGKQDTIIIRSQMGEFECTPKHKIAVLTGFEEYEWKQARNLVEGDRMIFLDHVLPGTKTSLPTWDYVPESRHSTTCKDISIPSLDSDISWLIGLIHGDGYIYANHEEKGFNAHVSIGCDPKHPSISEKAIEQLARFGTNITVENGTKNDKCTRVRTQSKQLAWYLEHLKTPNTTMKIPNYLLQSTPDIRGSYLAGLYDADGSCTGKPLCLVASVYPKFLKQVQAMYSSLGIPTRLVLKREAQGNWQPLYYLNLVGKKAEENFDKYVRIYTNKCEQVYGRPFHDYGYPRELVIKSGLKHGRKWNKSNEQLVVSKYEEITNEKATLIPIKVIGIDNGNSRVETYDISVDSVHEFIAEGLLVHNTALIALGNPDDEDYVNAKNYKRVLPVLELDEYGYPKWEPKENGEGMTQVRKPLSQCVQELGQEKAEELLDLTWRQENHRWASNNSVLVDELFDDYHFVTAGIIANGEPGIVNMWLSQNYGRIIDGFQEMVDEDAIGTNPCGEITLASGENCNLVEFIPYICKKKGYDIERIIEIATQYSYRITFAKYIWPITTRIVEKNRRIGVSIGGIQDYFLDEYGQYAIEGFENDDITNPKFNQEMLLELDSWYQVVKRTNEKHAKALNANPSIKLTTVKPSGSISKLPGVSAGVHFHYSPYMIQRIRFAENDPNLDVLAYCGYPMEDDFKTPNTVVVEFPIKAPNADHPNFKCTDDFSLEEQIANQYLFAYAWADNAVSATVTFKPEEHDKIEHLLRAYGDKLKSTSLLPYSGHGYTQAPWEPITKEEYENRISKIDTPMHEAYKLISLVGDSELLDEECDSGMCPIR